MTVLPVSCVDLAWKNPTIGICIAVETSDHRHKTLTPWLGKEKKKKHYLV
jgi:hypothetical protein